MSLFQQPHTRLCVDGADVNLIQYALILSTLIKIVQTAMHRLIYVLKENRQFSLYCNLCILVGVRFGRGMVKTKIYYIRPWFKSIIVMFLISTIPPLYIDLYRKGRVLITSTFYLLSYTFRSYSLYICRYTQKIFSLGVVGTCMYNYKQIDKTKALAS